MKRISLAIAATAIALAGCASGSDETTAQDERSQAPNTSSAPAAPPTTTTDTGPTVVTLGRPYEIPCSASSPETCMTVTFNNIRENEPCQLHTGLKNDQAIALDVEVAMPADADPSFTSPFRSFPWSTFSSADQFTRAQTEFCNGDSSKLDLMAEFPGGNAQATVYLDVPADVRAVVFEPNRSDMFLIETTSPQPR